MLRVVCALLCCSKIIRIAGKVADEAQYCTRMSTAVNRRNCSCITRLATFARICGLCSLTTGESSKCIERGAAETNRISTTLGWHRQFHPGLISSDRGWVRRHPLLRIPGRDTATQKYVFHTVCTYTSARCQESLQRTCFCSSFLLQVFHTVCRLYDISVHAQIV